MSKKEEGADTSRRDFLKLASATAPAAAVAVMASGQDAEAASLDQPGEGLRDTAHTRAYLKSARF